MTIMNTVEGFVDDALNGFAAVHRGVVRRVDGGVVRTHPLRRDQVAVVIGGGSGHYPAFAGYVGTGLAAGAVCGNIFSSPSSAQAVRVVEEIEQGGGVLFLYGNYAGDVLHFGAAQDRLRRSGLDVRTVLVTDDVASAPAADRAMRRGVAGDLVVFKIASAAAERGDHIDEVERLARLANERTRTLGVAFDGCTLPGSDEALFHVEKGRMSIGLGIHGEPGLTERDIPTAAELSDIFVESLLAEAPSSSSAGRRISIIVNGLGSVSYEELFIVYGGVSERLEAAGYDIAAPECGELVTSLDMAGISVTLVWLDDELEALWAAPADAPGFRRGTVEPGHPVTDASDERNNRRRRSTAAPMRRVENNELRAAAGAVVVALEAARDAVKAEEKELGRLDSFAGDGDHGVGMLRGLNAACTAAQLAQEEGAGAAGVLNDAGIAWSDHAGGTSGALWGAALTAAGETLLERRGVEREAVAAAVAAALASVSSLGGAKPGDKTMIDAFVPFSESLTAAVDAGRALHEAWSGAAVVATSAALSTAELSPRLGRARPLAQKSIGHPDPGAVSFAIIVEALAPGFRAQVGSDVGEVAR